MVLDNANIIVSVRHRTINGSGKEGHRYYRIRTCPQWVGVAHPLLVADTIAVRACESRALNAAIAEFMASGRNFGSPELS